MTTLTDDEKRAIASRYRALRTAIDEGQSEDDVMRLAAAFQQAYHGESRPLVDAFGEADDKRAWAREVEYALAPAFGVEFWPLTAPPAPEASAPDAGAVAMPDEVVALPFSCDNCNTSLEVQCVPPLAAPVVTEHTFACPACRRMLTRELPGAIVDVTVPGDQRRAVPL